ncbi:MAG: hypothetical protein ABI837_17845, partial [Acidobacteriota bacterium]
MSEPRDQWKRILRPLGDCVAIERLGEALTPEEQQHITSCARCHAEMELWKGFNDETSAPEEADAVQWVAQELARRRTNAAAVPFVTPRKFATRPRLFAAAAMLFIAL